MLVKGATDIWRGMHSTMKQIAILKGYVRLIFARPGNFSMTGLDQEDDSY